MLTPHSFATAEAPAPVEVLGSGAAAACLWGAQMAPMLPAAALLSAKQAHLQVSISMSLMMCRTGLLMLG